MIYFMRPSSYFYLLKFQILEFCFLYFYLFIYFIPNNQASWILMIYIILCIQLCEALFPLYALNLMFNS